MQLRPRVCNVLVRYIIVSRIILLEKAEKTIPRAKTKGRDIHS